MSEAFFDKDSWSRAMGPALKTLGYFAAGFLLFYLLYVILLFLFSLIGADFAIQSLFGIIAPIVLVFYFILVFFKVLDEELLSRKQL